VALNAPRLDGALAQAVRDAGFERGDLLDKIEKIVARKQGKAHFALSEACWRRLGGSSTGIWRCALCSGQGYFLDKWCISAAARHRFPTH